MARILTATEIKALSMLSKTLAGHHIPYVVIGGLAAIEWGARRPLEDIDIQVGKASIQQVRDVFADHITADLRHYKNEHWDIEQQIVISLGGVSIDICQAERFYVVSKGQKHLVKNTIPLAVTEHFGGVAVPVMPEPELIRYKRLLARPVDLMDVAALE